MIRAIVQIIHPTLGVRIIKQFTCLQSSIKVKCFLFLVVNVPSLFNITFTLIQKSVLAGGFKRYIIQKRTTTPIAANTLADTNETTAAPLSISGQGFNSPLITISGNATVRLALAASATDLKHSLERPWTEFVHA